MQNLNTDENFLHVGCLCAEKKKFVVKILWGFIRKTIMYFHGFWKVSDAVSFYWNLILNKGWCRRRCIRPQILAQRHNMNKQVPKSDHWIQNENISLWSEWCNESILYCFNSYCAIQIVLQTFYHIAADGLQCKVI